MRIKTIKRNTNYLLKMLDDFAMANKDKMIHDLKELDSKSRAIKKLMSDMDILFAKTGKKSSKYTDFEKALETVSKIAGKKYDVLAAHDNHNKNIQHQIYLQSDMAIRKLLLELETGGNVRFEDEQKDEAWVKECEALVKVFIKKTITPNSPKSVQIHRLSKLHNRNLKIMLEGKLGPKINQPNYAFHLCCKLKQSEMDAFEILENGFREDSEFSFSNYIDSTLSENSFTEFETSRKLKRALIVKVYTDRIEEYKGGICLLFNPKRTYLKSIPRYFILQMLFSKLNHLAQLRPA